jgi:sugar phosphate isomerase/epimerase
MTTSMENNIAVRDQIVPVRPGRSFFDVLREVGVDAVELEVAPDLSVPHIKGEDGRPLFSLATPASIQMLKERFEAEKIRVTALMLATDFSGDAAEAHVAWAVRAAHAARTLDAPALRIDTWTRRTDLPVATIVDNFARRIRRVLDETTGTSVGLGIENHGALSNDPAFLDAVFAAVDDPRLGLTLDTGNFYWYGHPLSDVYAIIERFAPRAKHTHIKNIAYPAELIETKRAIGYEYGRYAAPLDEGNIDVARVVRLLREAGYRGDLCVENEALSRYGGPEQQIEILRRDIQTLRTALQNEARI